MRLLEMPVCNFKHMKSTGDFLLQKKEEKRHKKREYSFVLLTSNIVFSINSNSFLIKHVSVA